jgi:hypothetical protein
MSGLGGCVTVLRRGGGGFDANYETLRGFERVLVSTGLTAAARVRAQGMSCGICREQSGTGAGFIRVLRFPRVDIVVGIATGYGLDDPGVGVRVPVGSRIFSSRRPERLWGSPNLISNEHRGLFPRG